MLKTLNPIRMGGVDVLPLVEGGKGVSISNGVSSGAWASCGGVGTFSAVNADSFTPDGRLIRQTYEGRTRRERHEELVAYGIQGGIQQARTAYELSGGKGRIHANILWEMGGAERMAVTEVLEQAPRGVINGITCGAGMPYRLSPRSRPASTSITTRSSRSSRAFNALWRRAYSQGVQRSGWAAWSTKTPGSPAVTTACRTARDPDQAGKTPIPRVLALRKQMREYGLHDTPDHHGRRRLVAGGMGALDRQSRNSARSPSSSAPAPC